MSSRSLVKHLENNKMIKNSQYTFIKTKLNFFYGKEMAFVDVGRAMNAIYPSSSKALDTGFQDILIMKLRKYLTP